MAKQYYWLKFQKDFFNSLRIKKLRKLAGGDTYTIIYLKLQLLSLATNGYLEYTGTFDSFEEEMSEEIGEDVDNIKVTVQYLLACGLMVKTDNTYFLPYVPQNTGKESESAERVRNHREKQKALQCNNDVTECNGDVTACNTEKEKDIDKEKDIEKEKEKEEKKAINDFFESIWKLYPNKLGKGSISDTKKKELYKIGYDEISRCIERYKAKIEEEGIEKQFIKYGSTFFNSGYVDYLDENYEEQETIPCQQATVSTDVKGGKRWQG